MKGKSILEMLGLKTKFQFENTLYENYHKKNNSQDFLQEKRLITREGHLD